MSQTDSYGTMVRLHGAPTSGPLLASDPKAFPLAAQRPCSVGPASVHALTAVAEAAPPIRHRLLPLCREALAVRPVPVMAASMPAGDG